MRKAFVDHQISLEAANGDDDDWETDPDFVVSRHRNNVRTVFQIMPFLLPETDKNVCGQTDMGSIARPAAKS